MKKHEDSKQWIPVSKVVHTHQFIDKDGNKKADQDVTVSYTSIESLTYQNVAELNFKPEVSDAANEENNTPS